MNKKRFFTCLIITSFITAISFVVLNNQHTAQADGCVGSGCSSSESDDMNNGCKSGYCIASSFGGSWMYYDFSASDIASKQVTISAPNNNEGPSSHTFDISSCVDAGASGYYRSAYIFRYVATGLTKNPPEQWAVLSNSEYSNFGGGVVYRDDLGIPWGQAQSAYNVASSKYPLPDPWETVSFFCYNPDWGGIVTPKPDPNSGDGYFRAKSTVQVNANGADHVPGIPAQTSEYDDSVYVSFSTDGDTATVNFSHLLDYTNSNVNWTEHGHGHDDFSNSPTSNWTVTNDGGGGNGSRSANGRISVGSTNSAIAYGLTPVTVTVPKGQTVTTCSTISYDKNVSFTSTPHKAVADDPTTSKDESHEAYNTWTAGSATGKGYSTACAVITHPDDPHGSVSAGGSGTSNVMFTGETSEVGWDVSGSHHDTRRLTGYRAIVFDYAATLNYATSLVSANTRSSNDPCRYYGSHNSCQIIDNIMSSNWNRSHYMNDKRPIIVPNNVGYKYCNSFGYYYESFYGTRKGSRGSYNWTPTGYNYWYNFDAVCRTIAKKPSAAVWNSSLMSLGGAKTSLAYRYDDARMGLVAGGQNRTLYGSWSEFLNVINSNITGLTSGGSLAVGSKRHNGTDICRDVLANNNSPLTIANSDCGNLGHSGVVNNSTFLTRLNTYLKNNDSVNHISASQLGTNMTGTNVVRHTGDLNITSNVTTAPGPYDSIYQIPQVIIFVDNGNVNISSNVTQIDAWIIAPNGTINTCSDFQNGVTEADAIRRGYGLCTQQLVFNGPVMANNLRLNRSFGSDPNINYRFGTFGAPSSKQAVGEVFNLRADTYLWAYAQAGRYDSSYTDSYTRELAPRY